MDKQRRGLIIFDLDGTLFRTETATVPAIQQVFQELHLPEPDRRVILSFFGKPAGEYHAWLRTQFRPEQAHAVVSRVDQLELYYAATQGELYPGVQQALVEIQAMTVQMALCSNGPLPYVEHIVSVHGLAHFFHRVRCWQSDGDNKTTMIGELLAAVHARPAVMVGDRGNDIEAAHQHGAAAIGIAYGYGTPQELSLADARAVSALELPALIRSLLS